MIDDLIPKSEQGKARRRYLVRKGVVLGRPLVGPLEVMVIPTYKCHYRCLFCALESEAPAKKPDISLELLHGLIDDLAAIDAEQISYTGGGEPLLYKGIDELVAHTREKGIAVSICTNGERLNAERIERFARLGVHLSISINAADEELYQKIHPGTKPGTFQRITENLTEFVRIANTEGGEGSFVSLNFVLMNVNFDQVGPMAKLGRKIGANQIQFRHIQPRPVHAHLRLDPDQLKRAQQSIRQVEEAYRDVDNFTIQVMEILRSKQVVVSVENSLPAAAGGRFTETAGDLERVGCLEGYIASYIDSDGIVFPCCMRSTSITNHWMGTLAESSFSEIWHSEAYRNFRRESFLIDPTTESDQENSCRFCPKAKQFVHLIDELAPGNYSHLYRGLAEQLYSDLEVQRRKIGDDNLLTISGARVEYLQHDIPQSVGVSERFTANVVVRNSGDQTWPGVEHNCAVGLGYHLLSRWKRMVRFDNNPRTYLEAPVEPGKQATLPLAIQAPSRPGRYFIELAMIQENVAWFESMGGQTLRIPLQVVS